MLRRPRDFAGARIGIRPGGVATQTFAALGGKAVVYVPGDPAAVSRLDGAELDVDVIAGNAYDRGSRALTANVNLWPRAVTLVMNKRSFEPTLGKAEAGAHQLRPAAVAPDVKAFAETRRSGHPGALPSRAEVGQRHRFRPTRTAERATTRLRRRSSGTLRPRRAIAEIQSLKSGLGAAGAPTVSKCGGNATAGTGQSSPIDGTYRSNVTRAQLLSNPKFEPGEDNPSNYGQFTLTIGDGRFQWRGSADGIPEGGTATVHGDRVTLRPTYPADAIGPRVRLHAGAATGAFSRSPRSR